MLVVYDSKTGNVKRFVNKLEMRTMSIDEYHDIDEPYVLITYTTGFGQVPEKVASFLEAKHGMLRGVAASGNRNWGTGFAKSADTISQKYDVPVIAKFELSGTTQDRLHFVERVQTIEAY
ncbi:class Ib ribonucleoside-diphosphate reductase assembly flavoprotein NrdI [Paenibacillus sp. J5C_2022]|uniref:class Ib ribonucleoside-diphosphate reductase assembly flavoprotein NrdI n=1 Tax=Paenibacillus sp. J5C2022 TaxID=2977129 RepID=UPI0021CFAF23|nr:class Ib ribonucleoside-diphosphate reductase assembly flavoprotein NrdI [Paenibacillus sp. J5C2022]MCU6709540.1 class Ib ribonucleoside-diphosphate reductase assembly flavoprotein NrdI [Paenibacillus sp. J5C2022]